MSEMQGAYGGDAKADSSQEIVIELSILDNCIERLKNVTEELENKIQPILSQPTPTVEEKNAKLEKNITAPLALQIQGYKNRIDSATDSLSSLISRVEL